MTQGQVLGAIAVIVLVIVAAQKLTNEAQNKKVAEAQRPKEIVGHAKLGTSESLTDKVGGIRLAFDKLTGKILRFAKKEGNGLVVGSTGSGKGTTWMITAILDLAGRASIVYVDLKGTTTAICGDYLASKGRLIVCSPYENHKDLFPMTLPRSTPFNVLAGLDPDMPGFTAECERIASTLADNDKLDNENSSYFRDQAIELIAGVIMHACCRMREENCNLTTVRNIITSSNGEDFWGFVIDAKVNGTRYVQQKIGPYAEVDDEGELLARERKSVADVLATASRYTRWFGNEDIGPSLEEDGFRYDPVKDEPTAVGLVCPLQYLHSGGGKWLKLHITTAIHTLWRKGRGKQVVYFILDESDQYADPIIHAALNTARNFGIVLIVMVQQCSDIEHRYGKQMGAFINGTAWKIFFASDDESTRQIVEKLSGTKAVMVPSVSLEGNPSGSAKLSFGEKGIPLKAGYELGELADDECILHVKGVGILEAKRKPYWEDQTLDGKWRKDPFEE
jgi:type IV secretory pathway TraG/TraD family ATPase VirD4